jgi:hypothetical protein
LPQNTETVFARYLAVLPGNIGCFLLCHTKFSSRFVYLQIR